MAEMPPQSIRALLRLHDRGPPRCPLPSLRREEIPWLAKKPPPNLPIETRENRLAIRGEKQTNDEEKTGDVLYQGIAARTFERSFQLADHVQVKGASLENGLLHIDLVREIPEAMKPRAIPIASSSKVLEVQPTKLAA